MVDLDLRLNVIYLKIEMKVLVDRLFYDLLALISYTESDNSEIRIVATLLHSFPFSGNGKKLTSLRFIWIYLITWTFLNLLGMFSDLPINASM